MADTKLADISEWQQNIDAPTYIGAGYTCLIVRAHNGNRADDYWPSRRDYLRKYNFTALGWYQYMVASKDAAAQANAFVSCVGDLRGNEFVILDSEEGSGDQSARCNQWFSIVDKRYGMPSTLYASQSWFKDHLGGVGKWSGRPRWMAAYSSKEPSDAHELWQNTDRASFPGIGSSIDGNIYHGSAPDFAKTMRGGKAPAPSPTPTPTPTPDEGFEPFVIVKADGRLEAFTQKASGEVLHAWQTAPNAGWAGSGPGKAASWYSLGNPGK